MWKSLICSGVRTTRGISKAIQTMMTVKTMETRGRRNEKKKKKSKTKGREVGDLLEGLGWILWSSDVMFSPAWFWR